MRVLDRHCADIGRDPKEIQRSAAAALWMSEDKAFIDGMKRRYGAQGAMIGSVEEIREVVGQYADAGVDELIIADYNLGSKSERIEAMDTFIKEIVGR